MMQHVSVVSGSYVDSLSYIKARCRITIDLKKIWSVFSHWIKAPITEKGNVSTLPKLCQENGQKTSKRMSLNSKQAQN